METSQLYLEMPGGSRRSFSHLVLDFTGTLSRDGTLLPGVAERLVKLSETVRVLVLTADTFGTAVEEITRITGSSSTPPSSGVPVSDPSSLRPSDPSQSDPSPSPLEVRIIRDSAEKASVVRALGADAVIAIGNGRNDIGMFQAAALSIAVIGPEGAAAELVLAADVLTTDIRDALDLVLHPLRLKATLRD
jgi:soluble P-type ATPase